MLSANQLAALIILSECIAKILSELLISTENILVSVSSRDLKQVAKILHINFVERA